LRLIQVLPPYPPPICKNKNSLSGGGAVAWADVWTGACARAAETRANIKKAATVALVRKLMNVFPVEKSQRNNQEGWDWKWQLCTYSTRPAAAFRQGCIPPQSNAISKSLADGSASSDRPLVLKGQNVLNFLLQGADEPPPKLWQKRKQCRRTFPLEQLGEHSGD
jgi:hypothetical protein